MDRRLFLRRGGVALAGGLVLGDVALEAFERLTYRKRLWTGASFPAAGGPYYWVHVKRHADHEAADAELWVSDLVDRTDGRIIRVDRNVVGSIHYTLPDYPGRTRFVGAAWV